MFNHKNIKIFAHYFILLYFCFRVIIYIDFYLNINVNI